MSIKVIVNSIPKTRVSINNQQRESIRTVGISPTIANRLSSLVDVDTSESNNNETLVYDETTGMYVIKELPVVNGGSY